jgi:hypothetical protein
MTRILFILGFTCFLTVLKAQTDTSVHRTHHSEQAAHNIKLATTLALIPGAGQIYNKKYWKAPIFWGAMGGSIYYFSSLQGDFNSYNAVLQHIIDHPSLTTRAALEADAPTLYASVPSPFYQSSSNGVAQEAIGYMEQLRTAREYAAFGIIGVYLLSILDANIDAHLYDFNISDDLSLKPQITQKQYFANHESSAIQPGLSLTLHLK